MAKINRTDEVTTENAPKKRGRPKGSKNKKSSDRDKITRAKAIRLQCEECMGFQIALIRDCSDQACALWPFRMGRGQIHTDIPVRTK